MIVPAVFAGVMIGLFAMQYFSATSGLSTRPLGGDDDRGDRAPGDERPREQGAARAGADRPPDRARQPGTDAGRPADQVAEASEEHPVMLLLFDLNGFKHYNDTFGHPAGDELLTGSAVRCATRRRRRHRLPHRRRRVLRAADLRPERFEGGHVPRREARDRRSGAGLRRQLRLGRRSNVARRGSRRPAPRMQLADVRMYAQKESRRLAHRTEARASVRSCQAPAPMPTSAREIDLPAGKVRYREAGEGSPSSSSTATSSTAASGTVSSTTSPIVTAASPPTGRSAHSRSR